MSVSVFAEGVQVVPSPLHMGWDEVNVFADTTADLRPVNAVANVINYSISPQYFQSAGTALLFGRNFSWHDDKNSPRGALVNKEFVRKVLGSAPDAIGRYYKVSDGARIQVVGMWMMANTQLTSQKLHSLRCCSQFRT